MNLYLRISFFLRKFLSIWSSFFILVIIVNCQSSSEDNKEKENTKTTEGNNTILSKPIPVSPKNAQKNVAEYSKLTWSKNGVSDKQKVKYDVYFGKSVNSIIKITPQPIEETNYIFSLSSQQGGEEGSTYYWKVVAIDDTGTTNASDIFYYTIRINLKFKVTITPPSDALKQSVADLGISIQEEKVKKAAKNGASFWEDIIQNYHPDILAADSQKEFSDTFVVNLSYTDKLVGNTLADATPRNTRLWMPTNSEVVPNNFAKSGIVRINVYLTGSANLEIIIKHEIAHALGFGTLFAEVKNPFVTPPIPAYSLLNSDKNYVGKHGLAAYRKEFIGKNSASFIPLTQNDDGGHLIEDSNIKRKDGKSLAEALLSPDVQGAGILTETTKGMLRDLGFILK